MSLRQTTLKDIAQKLGLSTSTVSRALKNNPVISLKTRLTVQELAKELNYAPNQIALSLRNQETKIIGVIIPEIVHYFFSSVIAGIEDIAYQNGYTVMFCQSNESFTKEVKDTMALLANRVDGLLISQSKETENYDHFREVQRQGVPLVFFDRAPNEIDASKVIIDDENAAFEATSHLIEQGCTNIVHLASGLNLDISQKRISGFKKALTKHEIPFVANCIINCNEGLKKDGFSNLREHLNLYPHVDGVFTSNDTLAIGAMEAIQEFGLKIPRDIAVIGFSNWDFCTLLKPALSSVNQPGLEMGQLAMNTLLGHLQCKTASILTKTHILKSKVIKRGSSDRSKISESLHLMK